MYNLINQSQFLRKIHKIDKSDQLIETNDA